MDGKKKAGAAMEFMGILAIVLLDVFIALNWASSSAGRMWLVSISTGDMLVVLLANALMLYFSGHLLHDHSHNQQQTNKQSRTNSAR